MTLSDKGQRVGVHTACTRAKTRGVHFIPPPPKSQSPESDLLLNILLS